MGLLDTLKSLLGLDGGEDRRSEDVNVTVEREGAAREDREDTAPEDAVAAAEDETETGADEPAADDEADPEPDPDGPAAASVDEIKGIGPAYAERLSGVGIETVGDLAAADPAVVAAETDLSETRVSGWVERAQVRVR